jgi:preprotein translocase subunit SecA
MKRKGTENMGLLDKIFGSYSERELKKIRPIADAVEKLDGVYGAMSDEELKGKTEEFRARLAAGETTDIALYRADENRVVTVTFDEERPA